MHVCVFSFDQIYTRIQCQQNVILDGVTEMNWARQRVEKRLLRNRTAQQLGKHILALFEQKQAISCTICHQTTGHSSLSKFLRETCGGPHEHDAADTLRATRPSVQHNQQVQSERFRLRFFQNLHSVVSPDLLTCFFSQSGVQCDTN